MNWAELAKTAPTIIGVVADSLSSVIGIATIFAFFRYRGRISAALRIMKLNHLHDRRNEIKRTLDLIDSAFIVKGRGVEIRSLFGRLNGQMVPLCSVIPELQALQLQVDEIAHRNGKLNEVIKQQIVHQVNAQFESAMYASLNNAAGEK